MERERCMVEGREGGEEHGRGGGREGRSMVEGGGEEHGGGEGGREGRSMVEEGGEVERGGAW